MAARPGASRQRPVHPARVAPLGASLRAVLPGLLALLALLLPVGAAAASPGAVDDAPDGTGAAVELVRFVGAGCSTCAEQSAWLDDVVPRYPGLEVVEHEVWSDAQARALFVRTGEELGFEASSVPTTVLDRRVSIGWTDAIADDLTAALDLAAAGEPVPSGVYGTPGAGTCSQDALACETADGPAVDVPLLGEVDLRASPLLLSTLVVGLVDGVNPCSLWAISVLLALAGVVVVAPEVMEHPLRALAVFAAAGALTVVVHGVTTAARRRAAAAGAAGVGEDPDRDGPGGPQDRGRIRVGT